MRQVPLAAILYFGVVFAVGLLLGPMRVLWLEPKVGPTLAVLVEVPILLAAMIVAARWVPILLHMPTNIGAMSATGLGALGLVLAADFAVGTWLRGLTAQDHFEHVLTPAGLIYAASLVLFAAMPVLANRPSGALATAWRRRWRQPDPAALAAYAGLRPFVVVTGGSDGIGLALARQFARTRHDLLLVARTPGPLDQAAAAIRADCKGEVASLSLDVTAPDAIARIEAALAEQRAYADVLVNSAGIGLAGPFLEQPPQAIDRLVALNVAALTSLTRHYLAGMRARGRGGILNVASLGGYAPGPYQAAYYASKAYVISFSEALAAETAGEGVRVCVLAPGPVATQFHERTGGASAYYLRLLPVSSPDSVARAGYLGFSLGWRVTVPGLISPVLALAMRLTPHRIVIPIVAWLLKPRGPQGHTEARDAGR